MQVKFLANGEFVKLARLTRGLTQKQVSNAIDIPGVKLSRIEAGSADVNEGILAKLADALDYPVNFFSQDSMLRGPGTDGVFHRKRQSLSSKKLSQVYALGEVRRLELDKLVSWAGKRVCDTPISC